MAKDSIAVGTLNNLIKFTMTEISEMKRIAKLVDAIKVNETVGAVVAVAEAVSKVVEKRHRYNCGLERLEVGESGKAYGFFNSPDGQNGEYFSALKEVGFRHHFYQAEYYWGVRLGNSKIILTYTEGDIAIFVEPVSYQAPKH
jgi:hypothetical protein